VLACRDLTEQKVVERELESKIAELRSGRQALQESHATLEAVRGDLGLRVEQLGRLNHELKKLDEMKSNLLANVSHELQTPLVSIRGYTEMILKGRLGAITEEQRKGLGLSLKNIDRLISMIDNLLTFSRMEREASDIKLSTFPLESVVDESLEILQEKIRAKKLTVGQSLEEPDAAIRADRDKILQVFINLLSNAAKFNRDGGTIEVASRRGERGYLAVQIRDTGTGIPEESLDRIFERFYQEDATGSGPRPGSGIGLAIVRNILRLHGCTIRVESTVGVGSKFSFSLPLAHAEAPGAEPEVEPEAEPARAEPQAEAPPAVSVTEPAAEGGTEPESEPPREPVREPTATAPSAEGRTGDEPRPRFRVIRRPDR
jgi:signal transduction histidine kinase